MPPHVARNVETVHAIYTEEEHRVTRHQRAIESVTAAVARPVTLYAMLAVVALWTVANGLAPHFGEHPWDPAPYFWLQGVVGLLGLLVATVVLITQARQGRLAERRAHLDLQVNLLSEQKIAKLIALVEELRRDLPIVRDRQDVEAEAMAAAADPLQVIQALETRLAEVEVEALAEGEVRRDAEVDGALPPPRDESGS